MPRPNRQALKAKLSNLAGNSQASPATRRVAFQAEEDPRIGGAPALAARIAVTTTFLAQDPGNINLEPLRKALGFIHKRRRDMDPPVLVAFRDRLLVVVADSNLNAEPRRALRRFLTLHTEIGYPDSEIWARLNAIGTSIPAEDVDAEELEALIGRWFTNP